MARGLWWWCARRALYHMVVLSDMRPLHQILLDFCARTLFWPDFRGQFRRPSSTQNGSCSISPESSQRLLSNGINFVRIGVRTRELWLPEVRVPELFFHVFLVKIPVKWGMPPVNWEFHVVAGVSIFPMHPGLWIKSQRAGKNPHAKAAVREEKCTRFSARFPYFLSVFARTFDLAPNLGFWRSWYHWKAFATLFLKVLDFQETELGPKRYGPANRGHQSVFGPPEGIFLIEIPARPGKILTIWEFHVVSKHILFPTHPGWRIKSLWVGKNLCASAASSGRKLWNFQHNLISSICFRAHGRRSSQLRILTILVSPESLCYLLSKSTGLAQRRTWVREIWSCEQRPLECSSCRGVIF